MGTGVPVVGVNFGRVGFLSSIPREELEQGVDRVLAGEVQVVELPTLEVEAGSERFVAVNDAVVTSGELGRMVELEWAVGGEDLGRVPCDGLICSTPSGSTAYNLSNGGPVLMWGLDAMAITFVAPHNLHAGPSSSRAGATWWCGTGHPTSPVRCSSTGTASRMPPRRGRSRSGSAKARSLLGTLPEATFVRRYRQSFARLKRASSGFGQVCRVGAPGLRSSRAPTPPDREPRPHPRGRARARCRAERASPERRAPARRSSPRRSACCSARRATRPLSGRRAARHTSRPSSTCPKDSSTTRSWPSLAELRPEDEPGLVLARRVFADGRTRAYAWGRAVAREDLAAATERLIAMSGQFEQRRLARPAYQLDVLDAFFGAEQLERRREAAAAWRDARSCAPAPRGARARTPARRPRASPSCEALVEDTDGHRARRGGRRCAPSGSGFATSTELGLERGAAAHALAPEEGEVRRRWPRDAERALAPLERARARARRGRRGAARPDACACRRSAATCTVSSRRSRRIRRGVEAVEARLDGSPSCAAPVPLRRRYEELLARRDEARAELDALAGGLDPVGCGSRGSRSAPSALRRRRGCAAGGARRAAAAAFAAAVAAGAAGRRHGGGRVRRRAAGAGSRPDGPRRGRLPDPAEPGHAVRAGRRDGLGRRALTRRARARGGRGRRDARLRRDRCRDRRRHRSPRGRDTGAARPSARR